MSKKEKVKQQIGELIERYNKIVDKKTLTRYTEEETKIVEGVVK